MAAGKPAGPEPPQPWPVKMSDSKHFWKTNKLSLTLHLPLKSSIPKRGAALFKAEKAILLEQGFTKDAGRRQSPQAQLRAQYPNFST